MSSTRDHRLYGGANQGRPAEPGTKRAKQSGQTETTSEVRKGAGHEGQKDMHRDGDRFWSEGPAAVVVGHGCGEAHYIKLHIKDGSC